MLKLILFSMLVSLPLQSYAAQAKDFKDQYKRPKSIPYPEDNKYTKAREELGKMLFFDPRLSGSNLISCASCHNPSFSWEDSLPKAVGHGHKVLGRGTPTILNLAWTPRLFWDGRASSLEEQALGPIEAAGEMNMKLKDLPGKIKNIKGYKPFFRAAYPKENITNKTIAKAIATFERTIVSSQAPFDQWLEGKENAISSDAKKGFLVFNTKAKCILCHSSWKFSDDSFHDIGLKSKDIGRGKFLKLSSQQHAFKTPGLRNIVERAPYMHDGSEKTLEEVVDFYDQGGDVKRKSLSPLITPLKLNKREKRQLVSFLKTLSSQDKPITLPKLPN